MKELMGCLSPEMQTQIVDADIFLLQCVCMGEFRPMNPEYVPNEGQDPRWPRAENIENLTAGWAYYYNLISGMPREWIKLFAQNQYGKLASNRPVYGEYNDAIHAKLADFCGKKETAA